MKTKSIAVCVMMLCGLVFVGGCAKHEIVKKEEPLVQALAASSMVKTEQPRNQPLSKTSIKESAAPLTVVPIPDRSELQSALKEIYFDLDSNTLSQEARATLRKNAEYLKKVSDVSVMIEGNCDERGSDEYNLALGERRAKAAMQFIVTMGVPAKRLSVISYGKEKPVTAGHDEASWAKNRRDEFVITKN